MQVDYENHAQQTEAQLACAVMELASYNNNLGAHNWVKIVLPRNEMKWPKNEPLDHIGKIAHSTRPRWNFYQATRHCCTKL